MKITTKPIEQPKAFKPFQLVIDVETARDAADIRKYLSDAHDTVLASNARSFLAVLHDKMITATIEAKS